MMRFRNRRLYIWKQNKSLRIRRQDKMMIDRKGAGVCRPFFENRQGFGSWENGQDLSGGNGYGNNLWCGYGNFAGK